ncbi:MAG: homoserine kinase [Methanomassiliicoccales archaeon]
MKPRESVSVRSPCSLSNLGPGFDVFGLALDGPFDVVEASRAERGVTVESVTGGFASDVPMEAGNNSAAVAARQVLERGGADFGLSLRLEKGVRPFSGLGSSGCSAAGGAYAANLLLEEPLPLGTVVECAMWGEHAVSGALHADNVGPSLLGGFTMVSSYRPFHIHRITPPRNLGVVISLPDIRVPTRRAREVLPSQVALKDMVHHVSRASGVVLGFRNEDIDLIGRSMKDAVIEEARAHLIPLLREAQNLALEYGASGSFLAGSGPAIASVFDSDLVDGGRIGRAMDELYRRNGHDCASWVTTWGEGCRRSE